MNNHPAAAIRRKLPQYLPSDGKIETKKQQTLNNGAFPFLYHWIYGNGASFLVKYKTKVGETKTADIQPELVKDLECDNRNRSDKTKDLQLDNLPGKIALLTIKTFDDRRLSGKHNFRNFLNSAFREIKSNSIRTLIIDLRGNAGGADAYGALLYAYLSDKPFRYFSSIESTKGKVSLKEDSLLGVLKPHENRFGGKVLFLINGLSFPTTSDFCAVAKSNRRGIFIGEESGGGYYGNTSGQTTKTELPQ